MALAVALNINSPRSGVAPPSLPPLPSATASTPAQPLVLSMPAQLAASPPPPPMTPPTPMEPHNYLFEPPPPSRSEWAFPNPRTHAPPPRPDAPFHPSSPAHHLSDVAHRMRALALQAPDAFGVPFLCPRDVPDGTSHPSNAAAAFQRPERPWRRREPMPRVATAPHPDPFTTFPTDTWLPPAGSPAVGTATDLSVLSVPAVETPVSPAKDPALFCDVCEVLCDTHLQLEKHQEGQKHRRKSDIHRVFVEARNKFADEGLKQIATDVWTCLHCKAQVQGKTPVLQHIEAVKHKKNRNAATALEVHGGKPQKNVRTPPRAPKGTLSPRSGPAAVAMMQLNGDVLPSMDSRSIGRALQLSGAVHGAVGDKQRPSEPPFSPAGKNRTVDSMNAAPQSVHTPVDTPTRDGSWSGWHRTDGRIVFELPPTFDPLRCPASSCVSPIRFASPSRSALFGEDIPGRPLPTVSPHRRSTSANRPNNHSKQSTPTKQDVNNLSCVLCHVNCNSVDTLSCHVASAKHKRRQALFEASQPTNEGAGTPSKNMVNRVFFKCDVCNVSCSGLENFESHLRGKLHSKRVRATASHAKTADNGN